MKDGLIYLGHLWRASTWPWEEGIHQLNSLESLPSHRSHPGCWAAPQTEEALEEEGHEQKETAEPCLEFPVLQPKGMSVKTLPLTLLYYYIETMFGMFIMVKLN